MNLSAPPAIHADAIRFRIDPEKSFIRFDGEAALHDLDGEADIRLPLLRRGLAQFLFALAPGQALAGAGSLPSPHGFLPAQE